MPRVRWEEQLCVSCEFVTKFAVYGFFAVHSPVFVFPELLVCLDCGKTEFMVPKAELDILTDRDTAKLG